MFLTGLLMRKLMMRKLATICHDLAGYLFIIYLFVYLWAKPVFHCHNIMVKSSLSECSDLPNTLLYTKISPSTFSPKTHFLLPTYTLAAQSFFFGVLTYDVSLWIFLETGFCCRKNNPSNKRIRSQGQIRSQSWS
jgi:hypothetical protein